jgi:hypothetical protein
MVAHNYANALQTLFRTRLHPQKESHLFTITYHRQLKKKRERKNRLDRGVGFHQSVGGVCTHCTTAYRNKTVSRTGLLLPRTAWAATVRALIIPNHLFFGCASISAQRNRWWPGTIIIIIINTSAINRVFMHRQPACR